ncbi:hypothetical protein ACA910_014589 [Epithemia clementina (nom. ined.)]
MTRHLSSSPDIDQSPQQCLSIDASNRSVEDWQVLTKYFLEDPNVQFTSSFDILNEWVSTIEFWSRTLTVKGVNNAIKLLHGMATHLNSFPKDDSSVYTFRLDSAKRTVNIVLKNWRLVLRKQSTSSKTASSESKSVQIEEDQLPSVSQMAHLMKQWRQMGIPITTLTYNNLVIQTAIDCAKTKAQIHELPIECEIVLESMLSELDVVTREPSVTGADFMEDDEDIQLRPNQHTFSLLLRAWAKSQRKDALKRALLLLEKMNELSTAGLIKSRPNTKMYNAILEIFCERKTVDDMRNAEQIFQDMDQGRINKDVYPDYVSYRIVFFGLCHILEKDDSAEACQRVVHFLHDMELAEQQHRILRTSKTDSRQPRVDSSMYAYLIMTFARLGKLEEAERVYLMFEKMRDDFGEDRFYPDVHMKRAMLFFHAARENPEEAEKCLFEMEQDFERNRQPNEAPRMAHYEAVIQCLLRTTNNNDSWKAAAAWIVHMLDLALTGGRQDLIPNTALINQVMEQLSHQKEEPPNQYIVSKDAPRDTEKFLRTMSDTERSLRLPYNLVNHDSYTRVIHAWARRSHDLDAPQRAEKLLLEMQRRSENGEVHLTPAASHYTGVISAWSHSRQKGSLHHAKEIFQEAYEQYSRGVFWARPDSVMYGSMISACTRARDLDGMEFYCNLMIRDFLQGNRTAQPTAEVLNSILIGFIKGGNSPASSTRVFDVIQQLKAYSHFDDRTKELLRHIKNARNQQHE